MATKQRADRLNLLPLSLRHILNHEIRSVQGMRGGEGGEGCRQSDRIVLSHLGDFQWV